MNEFKNLKALLVIFGEDDHYHGSPVSMALLEAAMKNGLKGATLSKGIAGFGAHNRLHSTHIFALSDDLPVSFLCVDEAAKIEAFLPIAESYVQEGLITTWDVVGKMKGKPPK